MDIPLKNLGYSTRLDHSKYWLELAAAPNWRPYSSKREKLIVIQQPVLKNLLAIERYKVRGSGNVHLSVVFSDTGFEPIALAMV